METHTDQERPRTALVAGATGALGAAIVALLLERGERVCAVYRRDGPAEELARRHPEARSQGRLRLHSADATDADQVGAVLDVLRADWGPLWLACNAVGGWAGGSPLEDTDDLTVFGQMFRRHLLTAAVVAREGLRHMGPAGGRVVLVSSAAALRPRAGEAAYAAAKAGVVTLVETLAREVSGTPRTVNAIVPTLLRTPANVAAMPDAPHALWPRPRDVAKVVGWLGGMDSWPVSGAAIPVPGDGVAREA